MMMLGVPICGAFTPAARRRGSSAAGYRRHAHERSRRDADADPDLPVTSPAANSTARLGLVRGSDDTSAFAEIQSANRSRASLAFGRGDADLQRPGHAIPLHAPHVGAPVRPGGDDFRPHPRGKRPGGSVVRQTKDSRRRFHRFSGFVRHLDRDSARGPRADRVDRALAFHDADQQDSGIVLRRERQAKIAGGLRKS